MIDQNRDGFIDKDDLHDMLASLGMPLKFAVCRVVTITMSCQVDRMKSFSFRGSGAIWDRATFWLGHVA